MHICVTAHHMGYFNLPTELATRKEAVLYLGTGVNTNRCNYLRQEKIQLNCVYANIGERHRYDRTG